MGPASRVAGERGRPGYAVPVRSLPFWFALLCACESAPPPAHYVLSDATAIDVGSDGAFAISAPDGRALISTASAPPVARRFGERTSMLYGFFTFRRSDVVEMPAHTFEGSEQVGDEVILRWRGDEGLTLTAEISVHGETSTRIRWTMDALDARSLALPIACDEASSFAGFGAQYDDIDQRGDAFALWVEEQGLGRSGSGPISGGPHTTYFPMPWWIDWRGFGVLVDTNARTLVDLCASDPNVAWIEVEDTAPLDVVVFHGPTVPGAIEALGDEIGRARRPPDWAFSPWIGVQGGREAVLAEAAALRAQSIPYSALWVQDWVGGRLLTETIYDLRYRWVEDAELYPDLPGLVRTLREDHGARFLAYANPFVVEELDHFEAMAAQGLLIRDETGAPYRFPVIMGRASLPDFTQPAAYEYVEGFLTRAVRELGFDGWMSDFGEWLPTDAVLADGSDARISHALYPAMWHRASMNVMERERPDGDFVVFTRSGWTRDHAVQQIVWIGDQEATFSETDGLPTVVPALLNLGLSGVPFVTSDVAGYSGGPSDRELFMRWTELAAFGPILRTHEGLMPAANWSWDRDEETIAHFRRFARIHEALGSEIRALADEAAQTSMPIVRHLALEFPDDALSRTIGDQYLLGSSLLVAPVVEEGATTREVYLPPGRWFHVWSGVEHEGGRTISIEAPIGAPAVFSLGADRPELRAIE
jgi:sulfoquinovosidase